MEGALVWISKPSVAEQVRRSTPRFRCATIKLRAMVRHRFDDAPIVSLTRRSLVNVSLPAASRTVAGRPWREDLLQDIGLAGRANQMGVLQPFVVMDRMNFVDAIVLRA